MINAKPDEIFALAEALMSERAKLGQLTGDLASLRNSLSRLWPDAKGEEVRREILRIEELNGVADEVLDSQAQALIAAYETFVAAQNIDIGGGGRV